MKTLLAALMGWTLLSMGQAMACVGCREPGSDTVTSEPTTVLAGFGLSWSVLFMLFVTMSGFFGLFLYIWRTVVRLEQERAQA